MKSIIQNIKENYKLVIGVLITGLLLGWLFFHSSDSQGELKETTELHEENDHEEEATTWTCSMHPQIKQDKPGDCPICGMDLIPLESMDSGDEDFDPNEVMLSEAAANLADIQTTEVVKGTPVKTLHLQGKVETDERNLAELTARFGGRIEKLYVNFTGERVQKGEKLASIYSPELLSAQRELIEAVALKENRPAMYQAAKDKLKLWDLSDAQIAQIESLGEPMKYFDILSPISGTIMKRHVALGDYVKVGNPLFMVVDLSKVWVMFDAYEDDLPWISVGDKIEFTVQSLPGKKYSAKVTFVDPFIDPKTRSAKVRVEVPNSERKLKPEMFATGQLYSEIAQNTNQLIIPKSSVLWTGKRSVVYVKVPERENPTFLYREIVQGPEAGNFYVVESGLSEGEEIATNGVFKIDASAQLEGKMSMMSPSGGGAPAVHDHGNGGVTTSEEEHAAMEMEEEEEEINTPEQFKKQLTGVYNTYLKLKDAFIESDNHKVNKEAAELLKDMKKVDMGLLKGDAHMVWMDHLEVLNKTIELISKSSDIEKQRQEFAKFNLTFYKSLKTFGLSNTTAYFQYCPMANRDQGAYWFSDSKEIRNPYFGDAMLGCGETRETIK